MDVRLFGEVSVAVNGERRKVNAALRAGVLALLAMNPRRAVSLDAMADRLWGEKIPASHRSVLYGHISRLRQLIRPLPDIAIENGRSSSYRLDVDEGRIDVFVMRKAAREARKAAGAGDHGEALAHWRRAEACCHGRPLGDVEGPWADRTRSRLLHERDEILAGRFGGELALGRPAGVLTALAEAVDRRPHSEIFASLLIRALYLEGRRAEALDCYAQTVARLREDLGIDPGDALRELHRSILRGDALPQAKTDTGPDKKVSVPRQLPPPPTGIVGRRGQFDDLDGRLGTEGVPILLVTGMAGLGKTSVVLQWAHRVAGHFADGQLFIDVRGFDAAPSREPSEILAGFLSALGVPGRDIPDALHDRASLYRSHTAGKTLLVVVDNASEADQVRLLTPTGSGSLVLVTSRDRLSGLVARDGAHHIGLDVLSAEECASLLAERLGERRIAAEPGPVGELAELCGRLPLALRIAAAQLTERPETSIAAHVGELAGEDRLRALSIPGDSSASVRPAFEASYLRLDDRSRTVFRRLGQVPGPDIGTVAAAALLECTPSQARETLRRLVSVHLVQSASTDRHRLHDLLKDYARRLGDGPEAQRTWRRLAHWYVHAARAASNVISPGSAKLPAPGADFDVPRFTGLDEVMAWYDGEIDNLLAVFRTAAVDGPPEVTWLLAEAMRLYLGRSTRYPAFKEVVGTGLDLALTERNLPAVAAMRGFLALYAKFSGDLTGSLEWASAAVSAARDAGEAEYLADALTSRAATRYTLGQLGTAIDDCEEALALPGIGLREQTHALGVKGKASRELGRLGESMRALHRKGELLLGVRHRMAEVHGELALAYLSVGDLPKALEAARAATASSLLGNPAERAVRADTLACVLTARGEFDRAREVLLPALALVADDQDRLFRVPLLITASRCHPGDRAAVAYAEEAVGLATGLGGLWVRTDAEIAAGQAHLGVGDHDKAARHTEQAAATASANGYRQLQAEALTVLAQARLGAGDAGAAGSAAQEALVINEEIGARLGQSQALLVLAQVTRGTPRARELAAAAERIAGECRLGGAPA
ncbi:BTAD domain-containing putative transcriptional regulator [Phytomonospora sp. NPDC050363]|uniref:AfsR/SARP family transcriptional regulator n=1 Tax=Phytomonospora sp. NPDC050363 TaxID=3155642 RepID=UPI0033EE68F1